MRVWSILISSRKSDKYHPLPSTGVFLGVLGAFPPGDDSSASTSTETPSREYLRTSDREANKSSSVFLAWRTGSIPVNVHSLNQLKDGVYLM